LMISEDVAEDAAAVRGAASQQPAEPPEAVQDAAVVGGQGVLELLGAAGLLDVLMEPAEQGVERRRHRLAGGVRVGAELLAELREGFIVELLLNHVDQGQGAPPLEIEVPGVRRLDVLLQEAKALAQARCSGTAPRVPSASCPFAALSSPR